MPFVSKAQNAWAHTEEGKKALGGESKVKEWEHATNYSHLPEHVNHGHAKPSYSLARSVRKKDG